MYVCECEPGYGHGEDDDTCSMEIDECKELQVNCLEFHFIESLHNTAD